MERVEGKAEGRDTEVGIDSLCGPRKTASHHGKKTWCRKEYNERDIVGEISAAGL